MFSSRCLVKNIGYLAIGRECERLRTEIGKGETEMSGDIKENFTRRGIWLRLVYMVVFIVSFNVAELVTFAVAAFQFLTSLFTGQPNDRFTQFGQKMARYLQPIVTYLTFATEDKPFPFAPWPNEPYKEPPVAADSNQLDEKVTSTKDVAENDEVKPKKPTTRRPPATRKKRTSRKTHPSEK